MSDDEQEFIITRESGRWLAENADHTRAATMVDPGASEYAAWYHRAQLALVEAIREDLAARDAARLEWASGVGALLAYDTARHEEDAEFDAVARFAEALYDAGVRVPEPQEEPMAQWELDLLAASEPAPSRWTFAVVRRDFPVGALVTVDDNAKNQGGGIHALHGQTVAVEGYREDEDEIVVKVSHGWVVRPRHLTCIAASRPDVTPKES